MIQYDDAKITETLREVEADISKTRTHEVAVIIDNNGNVVHRQKGHEHYVDGIPIEKVRDAVVTHNHPGGYTNLTTEDVRVLVHDEAKEVRAVTFDGRFSSLRRGGMVRSIDFENAVDVLYYSGDYEAYADSMVDRAIEIYGNTPTREQINQTAERYVNDWFRENAEKYGYIFREGAI